MKITSENKEAGKFLPSEKNKFYSSETRRA